MPRILRHEPANSISCIHPHKEITMPQVTLKRSGHGEPEGLRIRAPPRRVFPLRLMTSVCVRTLGGKLHFTDQPLWLGTSCSHYDSLGLGRVLYLSGECWLSRPLGLVQPFTIKKYIYIRRFHSIDTDSHIAQSNYSEYNKLNQESQHLQEHTHLAIMSGYNYYSTYSPWDYYYTSPTTYNYYTPEPRRHTSSRRRTTRTSRTYVVYCPPEYSVRIRL
jgi:hypothetical protein